MRRVSAVAAMVAAVFLGWSAPASAGGSYTADRAVKLDVIGEWAHPDDDTSIIGPCGVWHARYDVKCGIIMVTRGEGGGNAVGQELGPALGLRRENEDRVAHFRSGTVDIFNIDRVDFFYNTSAPLTQFFWGQDETLRRITRIIRTTQPEIYIGFTPSLNAGHGNSPATNPPPDYGLSACAITDGGIPPWGSDMSGRVIRDVVVDVNRRRQTIRVPLDAAARAALERDGSALISFETPAGEVQAFDVPLSRRRPGG